MNINRNNYEGHFISYIENELNAAQRKAVEDFVTMNPDLKNELELFVVTKLEADEKIIFADKESLLQKNSIKIIAWKWNINVWASAAILLLLLGVGWWMNQSSVDSYQFSVKKIDSTINSKSKNENQKIEKQLAKTESDFTSSSKNVESKKAIKQNFIAKIILPETIDTAELPNSWTNRKKWNEEHETHVVQDIFPQEIIQPKIIIAQVDTEKIQPKNILVQKKSDDKIIAQIPLKTNNQQHQILKMLSWLGGKISGDKQNDSNFDVAVGFVQISHREALANN